MRFAKDKNPYKTHAGAVLTRSGAKNDPGLLYIHIDPTGCFVAAGFYQPEPEALARLRAADRARARRPGRRWSPSSPTGGPRAHPTNTR